jgi:hypothetical protein
MFEVEDGTPPREVDRLDLPKEITIHEFHGSGDHRLFQERGVEAVAISETDRWRPSPSHLAGS